MARAIILVMDSFGIGATADAADFADEGADTFGHIALACANGSAEVGRSGALHLPNLTRLGLAHAASDSRGQVPAGFSLADTPQGAYGYAAELSTGKDTPSGHWEMAGVPVLFEWGYFRDKENSFPAELLQKIIERAGLPGVLGNCHASGTEILERLGEEHLRSGQPIFYTSADSVFQIACHEETFGLEQLYRLCEIVREELAPYNIGRVIARPFAGPSAMSFARTDNRKDYAIEPPAPTLLDHIVESGGEVVSVGKIADIYAHKGISKAVKAHGLDGLWNTTLAEVQAAKDQTLVFTNFVDFDSLYGHRRDLNGYALALEYFDTRLPELEQILQADDIVVITADHGCDPTWVGTEHTREHIPILIFGPNVTPQKLGQSDTFADIGQTIASHFATAPLAYGKNLLTNGE